MFERVQGPREVVVLADEYAKVRVARLIRAARAEVKRARSVDELRAMVARLADVSSAGR